MKKKITVSENLADAVLDLREDCLKHKKTLMYVLVDGDNPNKNLSIATPKNVLGKEDLDSMLSFFLNTSSFEKELGPTESHPIWLTLLKSIGPIYKFNLDGGHLEVTAVRMKDLIR